ATAAPMPRLPPVTSTTRPSSAPISGSGVSWGWWRSAPPAPWIRDSLIVVSEHVGHVDRGLDDPGIGEDLLGLVPLLLGLREEVAVTVVVERALQQGLVHGT